MSLNELPNVLAESTPPGAAIPAPVISLDDRFNGSQLRSLNDTKELYRAAPRAAKKELIQKTLDEFVAELVAQGEVLTKAQIGAIKSVRISYYRYRVRC